MNIQIRRAVEADIPALLALMKEFAEFENFAEFYEVTGERLAKAMFGPEAFVEGLIAMDDSSPIGYALFYPNFASFRGQRGYYLEDLFVSEAGRQKGTGEAMLREIAKAGKRRGFERIDFLVLDWNMPAIRFYQKLGAERGEEERHFKFAGSAFEELCAGEDPPKDRLG